MGDHPYLSTACRHDVHAECRKTCKFCFAGCLCRCHGPDYIEGLRYPDTSWAHLRRSPGDVP